MNILTEFWAQIQEAHLATQHGDPFAEIASLNPKSEISRWMTSMAASGKEHVSIRYWPIAYVRVNLRMVNNAIYLKDARYFLGTYLFPHL